ncbi:MAG: hypothetical protein AAF654_13915 [Myxococcota bacterium]
MTNWDQQALPDPCRACGTLPEVVLSLEAGDGNRTLWACRAHPDHAEFRWHK